MCDHVNFFIAGNGEEVTVFNHEDMWVEAVSGTCLDQRTLLHRDFFEYHRDQIGTYLRVYDGGCCFGASWASMYRFLALLIRNSCAAWGSVFYCFQGRRHSIVEERFRVESWDEAPPFGKVLKMLDLDVASVLKIVPSDRALKQYRFAARMHRVRSDLRRHSGGEIKLRTYSGRIVSGVLTHYHEMYGYCEVDCSDGVITLVPQQIWEVVSK